jgi:hypothetical protein
MTDYIFSVIDKVYKRPVNNIDKNNHESIISSLAQAW